MGSSPVENGAQWAEYALVTSSCASAAIPAAWLCTAIIYTSQCDPGKIYDVGQEWFQLSEALNAAHDAVQTTTSQLAPDDWSGQDRDEFNKRCDEYQTQLMAASLYATVVAGALLLMAFVLYAFILVMMAVAAVLALEAIVVVTMLAGVVTAIAAAAIEAEASATAMAAVEVLAACAGGAGVVAGSCAAAVGGGVLVDATQQYFRGDKDAFRNLGRATHDGLDNMYYGTMAMLERDLTAMVIGRGGLAGVIAGTKGVGDDENGEPLITGWIRGGRPDYNR